MIRSLSLIVTIAFSLPSFAQQIHEPAGSPEWSMPYEPFRVVGNLYYVGTYDLACYLIVTPKGNILINTGLAASATTIKENITKLGFKFSDTKILLTTQAHFDHVGAMAAIKKETGAKMFVDEKDAGVLADGGNSDYEMSKYGITYEPVKANRLLKDGDVIILGDTRIVMLHHPGHTKGSCSFSLDVKDGNRTYKVLIANMPTIITDKKLTEIPAYTDIAKDYSHTLTSMKNLTFDIWLSSHASQFNLHTKHKPGDAYNPEVFSDRKGYDESLRDLEEQYQKKMQQQ